MQGSSPGLLEANQIQTGYPLSLEPLPGLATAGPAAARLGAG